MQGSSDVSPDRFLRWKIWLVQVAATTVFTVWVLKALWHELGPIISPILLFLAEILSK